MKQKITFLFLISCSGLIFGQTMVNDFEAGSLAVEPLFGATASVVANPQPTSTVNTTSNCLQIGRTNDNWFSLVRINVDPDITIGPTETKYLSLLVYRLNTDLACRFNGDSDTSNGSNPGVIRAVNSHSGSDAWEELIIPVEFPRDAGTFSLGTLFNLVFHPNIKNFSNANPSILNNTDTFLYIDELKILDANPLSTKGFELEKSISLYPNPAQSSFKVTSRNNVEIKNVSIYTLLGKQIKSLKRINKNEYDISSLASGMYLVKMTDSNGGVASKKLIKN
ncbi:T9SS type A sorting domain-containing protein [Algibacter pectinivorans]|uniref:Por secretion system C-terminal sorting domain-containing protein n=1 Tax=Algibacter pectinivorans TaxID=870482 RepID=A0A1I1Q5S1_9FLAO|nr:T9SS type A sorting domain-containing protein [Algibacter pectinivorans]SFD17312.1 Por secretion system C-terminal sorting domain-containing protein [Algibacter pectinivorans]